VARHGGVAMTRIGICTKALTVEVTGSVDGGEASAPLPGGFGHFR